MNQLEDPTSWANSKDYDSKRHESERMKNGFSTYDWWNFCDYIAWVNIQALERFKTGAGYPADLSSMEEWVKELDIMIDGFKAHLTLSSLGYNDNTRKELDNARTEGLALYAKRFPSLWD